jgi:selenoprotein W-related protein
MVPSDGGKFEVWCNEKLIFSRKDEGGFIDVKFIKQRLRDEINPHMDLGHSDRKE